MRNFILSLHRWKSAVASSPLRRLGWLTAVAAGASVVAKGVGLLKEVVVAAAYGVSDGLDVYLLAFVLIGFPLSVFVNAVQAPLTRVLSTQSPSKGNEGETYYMAALVVLGILLIVLPVWLLTLQQSIAVLAADFTEEKREQLEAALYLLVPYYIFNSLNLLAYSALQSKGRFIANGLLPAVTAAVIAIVVLIYPHDDAWGVLSVALSIGTALECLALHLLIYRSGIRPTIRRSLTMEVRSALGGALALLPGTLIIAVGPVFERLIAAALGSGVVAALGYGFRLPAAINGILVAAISATVLPYFSRLLAENKVSYCQHSLERSAWGLLIGGGFLALILAVFSAEIVSLFFQRGAFDAAAAARVSPIQQVYFLQLPGAMVMMLCIRLLVASGRNILVSLLVGGSVVLQSLLAWWFGFSFGATGIAWASVVSTTVFAGVLYQQARFDLGRRLL